MPDVKVDRNIISSEKGGFHIFELHLPTLNNGSVAIVIVVVGFWIIFKLASMYCKYKRSTPATQIPLRTLDASRALEGRYPQFFESNV